jgi:hypothetical protein
MSSTKAGPLFNTIDTGIPNRGMISFSRHRHFPGLFSPCGEGLRRYRQTPTDICILELMAFQ